MSAKVLYIIGNGFDLHHGLPTSLSDFKNFLSARNPDLHTKVEEYLCDLSGNWANLEEALAYFNVDQLIDHASDFLISYAADDWSDAYHHDYQYEVNEVVSAISCKLKEEFYCWVQQIRINSISPGLKLSIEADSCFLNFNYTPTLQKLYSVEQSRVFHIHGTVDDDIVLGHGWEAKQRPKLGEGQDPEAIDTRVMEGNELINRYFEDTFKPTGDIIKRSKHFFSDLANVSDVYVWGHSLSEVDLPYFLEVFDATKVKCPVWHVSHYCTSSLTKNAAVMLAIGVANSRVRHDELSKYVLLQ